MISFGMLSRSNFLLFTAIFLLRSVLETLVYIHSSTSFSSGSGFNTPAELFRGTSLCFDSDYLSLDQSRRLIFQGTSSRCSFDNSWLGLVLTSSLFSFMHGPSNVKQKHLYSPDFQAGS